MAMNVTPIRKLVQILEKNVSTLKAESCSSDIDLKFRDKLEWFGKVSSSLTDKLQSLLYLSENYSFVNNDLKQFVNGIVNLWISVNKQVCEKCSKIRMASHTLSGVPLSLLIEKIKKESSRTKELLDTREDAYTSREYTECCALLDEIEDLLSNLKRCDHKARIYVNTAFKVAHCKDDSRKIETPVDKKNLLNKSNYIINLLDLQLQHYLAMSKLIPFLVKLEATVNEYASTIEVPLMNRAECTELDVFTIVAKLLTGELLDDEPMNPYHVLADNAPKKPVFIVKIKRRIDVPSISVVETVT
ncbi:hypothetical protein EAI_08717 [Harpegnathos saltator]|uniref:Uncharacterized protein n=1 Tax=Harpegnathos saltator TaxID=610380 RepID=E2C7F2_HARSA|nr:hypothetical protein EAI_08717 [Harpegnathos saltator]